MDNLERPLTIPAALAQAARRFPNRTAYIEGGAGSRHTISWAELQRLVSETAAGLIALGLQRGDRVAICAENGIEWIAAYLATALAGGAGVLVYYDLKPPEIAEQVTRPASRFLVASEGVIEKLGGGIPGVERVIAIGRSGKNAPPRRDALSFAGVALKATAESRRLLPGRAPSPDDLAAVIYTSGTTGGAKGVMLSHRNFLANGHSCCEALSFSERDSALLVLPMHHAMPFIAALILPMLVGACFVIENDLRRVRDRLQEHKPTIFFGVPALFEIVYRNVLARAEAEGRLATLQAWQRRGRLIKRLTGINIGPLVFFKIHKALGGKLRFLVSGGAALNPQTARDFFSLGLPLLQGWGMTEASPVIAVQRFSASKFRFSRFYEDHAGGVGPAVPGVEVRLIDVPEKDIRVSVSGEGEVIVRGDNVFQGYWQAEDATGDAKLDGWLRTGDLGRIDAGGNIYLTGRSKYVIVLESGEKVHPDELEDKLRESALLNDICVLGRKIGDKTQVTALVYPDPEAAQAAATADEPALRRLVSGEIDRLGKQLAAYKRVSRIELSDEPLPKTALQKVARGHIEASYDFSYEKWLAAAESSNPAG
ncbi:MAG: AMP-binding protein [Dehalococcoidia bacterium]|nr:AMP-binding protein [Dehalococcoidia bacterium]